MALYNSVKLTGYINTGRDENGNPNPLNLRTVGQGEKSFYSLNFTLSVPRDRKDRDGKRKYDYLNISIAGSTAKFVADYFKPGDLIVLEGFVSTRSYEKDGNKHYITEITVDGKVGFPLLKANGEERQQQQTRHQMHRAFQLRFRQQRQQERREQRQHRKPGQRFHRHSPRYRSIIVNPLTAISCAISIKYMAAADNCSTNSSISTFAKSWMHPASEPSDTGCISADASL